MNETQGKPVAWLVQAFVGAYFDMSEEEQLVCIHLPNGQHRFLVVCIVSTVNMLAKAPVDATGLIFLPYIDIN